MLDFYAGFLHTETLCIHNVIMHVTVYVSWPAQMWCTVNQGLIKNSPHDTNDCTGQLHRPHTTSTTPDHGIIVVFL